MQNDQKVALDPQCPSPSEFAEGCPKFSIDLHFLNDSENLNCVFTVKNFERGNVLMVARKTLAKGPQTSEPEIAEKLASRILNAIWRSYISDMSINSLPDSTPLHIGLFDASSEFDCEEGNWKNNDERLRQAVKDDDSDAVAKLVLATNIHLKYIKDGMVTMLGSDTRIQDEDEIEALVLACLPHIQSNGVLLLAAAKLLFYLDRGYRRLAVELAESAFKNSTAIASSLTIVGQMRMFLGEFEQAIEFLEQAQEISKENSQFSYYLMFVKCQSYLAEGNWSKLREALDEFYEKDPEAQFTVSIFFASAGGHKVQPESEAMAKSLTREQAIAILRITNYIYARLFTDIEPRINIFKGLTSLMINNFGMGIIPSEIRAAVPTLFND
ncbi:MAG: hypothetical protein AAED33_05660 [Paracoccaceae bacterium]|jgi:tetratricopeptide (TPR) repeat protein